MTLHGFDVTPASFFPSNDENNGSQKFVQHKGKPDAHKAETQMDAQQISNAHTHDPLAANADGYGECHIAHGLQIAYQNNIKAAAKLQQNIYPENLLSQSDDLRILLNSPNRGCANKAKITEMTIEMGVKRFSTCQF